MFDTEYRPHQIHVSAFVVPGASVVGDVTIAEDSSVWYNAVLRGDTESILVGTGSNIQDGVVVHADPGFPVVIGAGVTIGHNAVVHGARIANNVLVGMGAILLNGAAISHDCLIGAGALIPQGASYPAGVLILGSPGKVVRELNAAEIEQNRRSALTYVARAAAFKRNLWVATAGDTK